MGMQRILVQQQSGAACFLRISLPVGSDGKYTLLAEVGIRVSSDRRAVLFADSLLRIQFYHFCAMSSAVGVPPCIGEAMRTLVPTSAVIRFHMRTTSCWPSTMDTSSSTARRRARNRGQDTK